MKQRGESCLVVLYAISDIRGDIFTHINKDLRTSTNATPLTVKSTLFNLVSLPANHSHNRERVTLVQISCMYNQTHIYIRFQLLHSLFFNWEKFTFHQNFIYSRRFTNYEMIQHNLADGGVSSWICQIEWHILLRVFLMRCLSALVQLVSQPSYYLGLSASIVFTSFSVLISGICDKISSVSNLVFGGAFFVLHRCTHFSMDCTSIFCMTFVALSPYPRPFYPAEMVAFSHFGLLEEVPGSLLFCHSNSFVFPNYLSFYQPWLRFADFREVYWILVTWIWSVNTAISVEDWHQSLEGIKQPNKQYLYPQVEHKRADFLCFPTLLNTTFHMEVNRLNRKSPLLMEWIVLPRT